MEKCLAFVLGGGGARGALQVGAIRALLEAGYQPDLLVGTSIGAVNAACLALWGVNLDGVTALEWAYRDGAEACLMDTPGRLVWHVLSGRPFYTSQRAKEFLITAGFKEDIHFDQIQNVRLGLVGADLGSGQPVIFGLDLGQSVLEGVLASCTVPPWFAPIETGDQLIVDGGALSPLPIEPALSMGATEIIALDLKRSPTLSRSSRRLTQLEMTTTAFSQREEYLELALAQAKGVPVRFIELKSTIPTAVWDFNNSIQLIGTGYAIANRQIAAWTMQGQPEFARMA